MYLYAIVTVFPPSAKEERVVVSHGLRLCEPLSVTFLFAPTIFENLPTVLHVFFRKTKKWLPGPSDIV